MAMPERNRPDSRGCGSGYLFLNVSLQKMVESISTVKIKG
jgi:hypothetical protein